MKIVKVGDVWVRADLIRTIQPNYINESLTYVVVSIDDHGGGTFDIDVKVDNLDAANTFCEKLALEINSK